MRRAAGFTLIEILIGIVLTGVVALLVYGAASVAFDTEERLQVLDRAARSDRAWRTLVEDAVRNVRPTSDYDRATLVLEQQFDAGGTPADRLTMITAGATAPVTPDADWQVTLEGQRGGIGLNAAAIGVVNASSRTVFAPAAFTGLDVRVLAGSPNPEWVEQWHDRRFLPLAVEITYWTASGPLLPPILLTLPAGLDR